MVAVSAEESGLRALEWLMESLIEDGDEVIAVRVSDEDEADELNKKARNDFRDDASALLRKVLELNDEVSERSVSDSYCHVPSRVPLDIGLLGLFLQISVIVEFAAGKVTSTLMRLISLYRPDCEFLLSVFTQHNPPCDH